MNGIHDMGGMDGFGPVTPEENEPVFHAPWESRVYAMANFALRHAGVNIDEFRHAIERIPPGRYLNSSYYERWLAAIESVLVDHGVITREELPATSNSADTPAAALIANLTNATSLAPSARKRHRTRARFKVGDPVRTHEINPPGHTRMPRYARGKTGVVIRDWGVFVFPDTNAHHAGENRQHCYAVAFNARELWGKPMRARERVHIDLWEDYLEPMALEPVAPKSRTKKRGKR
jgi:nitrile hydratase beta subunit